MKPFQSRVVAAWIVALPIAYALVTSERHKIARLRTDAPAEIARQLSLGQHISFVSFFVMLFVIPVVLTVVIDTLGRGIQRFFPEPAISGASPDQSRPLG